MPEDDAPALSGLERLRLEAATRAGTTPAEEPPTSPTASVLTPEVLALIAEAVAQAQRDAAAPVQPAAVEPSAPPPPPAREPRGPSPAHDRLTLVLALVAVVVVVVFLATHAQGRVLRLVGDHVHDARALLLLVAVPALLALALVVPATARRARLLLTDEAPAVRPAPAALRVVREALVLLAAGAVATFVPGGGGDVRLRQYALDRGVGDALASAGIDATTTVLGLVLAAVLAVFLLAVLTGARSRLVAAGAGAAAAAAVLVTGVAGIHDPAGPNLFVTQLQGILITDPGPVTDVVPGTRITEVALHGCSQADLDLVLGTATVTGVDGCRGSLTFSVTGPADAEVHRYGVVETATSAQAAAAVAAVTPELPAALAPVAAGKLVLVFEGASEVNIDKRLYVALTGVQKTGA